MEKIEITVVVPEQIAALVQHYIQRELLGTSSYNFAEYLRSNKVSGPMQYLSEMEIGIKHPDDEPIKIASYEDSVHKEIRKWIEDNYFPQYKDRILDEDLYSIDLDDGSLNPPQQVLDFIASVKATGCSYFRFIK
jgi:hypothetical protein